jgi:hypothetical protein
MADRDTETLSDPLVEVTALEQRLGELDDEERELRQRLAETKRAVAVQRAASRPPVERAAPWKVAMGMYVVGLVASWLVHLIAR